MKTVKNLNPSCFDEFIGQTKSINILKAAVCSALKNRKPIDHVLIYGHAGLGKTTLAKIIANEMNTNFIYISSPTISNNIELISIFTNIKKNDIIFFDEIHRLPTKFEEILYTAIENFKLSFIYNNEENSKPIEVELPPFTFIGATTKINKISTPLKSRFPIGLSLVDYNDDEIFLIAKNIFEKSNIKIKEECIKIISNSCRNNPRLLKNIIKRIIDYSNYYSRRIDEYLIKLTLDDLQIYKNGLNSVDIDILKTIYVNYNNKPISLNIIGSLLNEKPEILESMNEIFLVNNGYIIRTKRGRILSDKGIVYLKENIL